MLRLIGPVFRNSPNWNRRHHLMIISTALRPPDRCMPILHRHSLQRKPCRPCSGMRIPVNRIFQQRQYRLRTRMHLKVLPCPAQKLPGQVHRTESKSNSETMASATAARHRARQPAMTVREFSSRLHRRHQTHRHHPPYCRQAHNRPCPKQRNNRQRRKSLFLR